MCCFKLFGIVGWVVAISDNILFQQTIFIEDFKQCVWVTGFDLLIFFDLRIVNHSCTFSLPALSFVIVRAFMSDFRKPRY